MRGRGADERQTCRDYVRPALARAGWTDNQIIEQFPVQADLPQGRVPSPSDRKRGADYVLELTPGLPLLVVEAKRSWARPADGIQQAMRYATKLGVPLALSTNGTGWVQYDATNGRQEAVDDVPTPVEAWDLLVADQNLGPLAQEYAIGAFDRRLLNADGSVKELRYYQRRAIHEALSAIAAGQNRVLLVMATGSGKTFTAMQLVWKLWNHRRQVQQTTVERNYRVLYLADRDILVSDPWKKTFRPVFNEASERVRAATARHSPDIYFATYQVLDTPDPGADRDAQPDETRDLLQKYPPDFFDLVIVDECHRGSARAESEWRTILDRFAPATQLGLTATPVDRNGADTYGYFGNPVYTYSLADGIADGFLAPYTIRRVVFDVDANGLEVIAGLVDVSGRTIPEGTYGTRDYERRLRLPDRTQAMARRIVEVMGDTSDRAVVFCVDAEHAAVMCEALRNLRPQRTRAEPEWVSRIMSIERDKTRLLEDFTDPERDIPQIAVTSSLLSTGVDIEDLKYVIIARAIGSMAEFKQIIGRGSRLYPDKGKTEFEIIDFVGATAKFNDPDFDGPPLKPPTTEAVAPNGDVETVSGNHPDIGASPAPEPNGSVVGVDEPEPPYDPGGTSGPDTEVTTPTRVVFELRGVPVTLVSEGFWVHDVSTGRPRLVSYVDWVRDRVLDRFGRPDALLLAWADSRSRTDVVSFLAEHRIDPRRLAAELGLASGGSIDTVDQLLHVAWDRPTMTRSERVRRAKTEHQAELDALPDRARAVLTLLLDRYAEAGIDEVSSAQVAQVPPLSTIGSPAQIAASFGGAEQWHAARETFQRWLYSA